MAGRRKAGKKTVGAGGKSKGGAEDAGKRPPVNTSYKEGATAPSGIDAGSVGSVGSAGDSGGVTPPTVPPGPPPAKHRGRKSNALIESERAQKEDALKAQEKAKRLKQASDLTPMLSGALKYLSRVFGEDEKLKKWAMTSDEADLIAGSSCLVLTKYANLEKIERFQEEIALIMALGSYAAPRIDFTPKPDTAEVKEADKPDAVA